MPLSSIGSDPRCFPVMNTITDMFDRSANRTKSPAAPAGEPEGASLGFVTAVVADSSDL
jgi:hypothetical protein